MALEAGTRLGPYEILSLLGSEGWARSTAPADRSGPHLKPGKTLAEPLPQIMVS